MPPTPSLVDIHPALRSTADAARFALVRARAALSRSELEAYVAEGADGTPTMRVDSLVEEEVLRAADRFGMNVLSEETGFVDRGSACTLVIDPLDGSANAAAGVPLSCYSAALSIDGDFVECLTMWLDTGELWWAKKGDAPSRRRTTGRTTVTGSAVSLLRPHPHNAVAWWRIARRAARVRILSCSTLEAALVAQGSTDAFVDAGSDTHRLVDLAAAVLLVGNAGGFVCDAFGRPIEFDTDLTRRWSGVVAASRPLAEELCEAIATASAPVGHASV